MSSKAALRASQILAGLRKTGSVSVETLCESFRVSEATVRRDLETLEQQGLLRRTHGGATLIEPLFYEPFRHDSSFQEQIGRYADEKRRIAAAAAELVRNGEMVALTAGTTTTEVVRHIRDVDGVTIVTSTVNVAMELSKRKDLEVLVTGGFLRGDWFSMVGPIANHAMSQVLLDKVFLGVNGIDAARGLTSGNSGEAALNAVMVQQARQRIVVADRSKLGKTASYLICRTSEVHLLITDSGAAEEDLEPFLKLGIEVRRV